MKTLYLDTPQSALSDSLAVVGLGIHEKMPARYHVDRPVGTSTFLFMQFHDSAEVYFDGKVRVCPARTTILWEPRMKHYFGHGRRQWDHSWMLCRGRMLARMLKIAGLALNRPLGADCDALMLKYLRAIYGELSRYSASDMLILEGLFALFIRELARAVRPKDQSPGVPSPPQPLRELLQEIESDLARPWRLEEMAAGVHLSVSHFSATFKRHFAMAPVEYVLRLRMKHAAWLLEDRSISISEAAYAAGFRDPLYFSKAFKRQYGASPRVFRQSRTAGVSPANPGYGRRDAGGTAAP